MKLTSIGDSIEGAKLELSTRKFQPKPPYRCKTLASTVYPYKLGVESSAEITKELSPKAAIYSAASHLNAGDVLLGETIFGISSAPLPKPNLVQRTGGHKGTALEIKKYGFAEIEIGLRALLQRAGALSSTPVLPNTSGSGK